MTTLLSFRDLFLESLHDLKNTEAQLLLTLPLLARAATHPELKAAFKTQLGQTRAQAARIDRIFGELGESTYQQASETLARLLDWAKESVEGNDNPTARDASLIAAAQYIEHNAIAAYGRARTYARLLGLERADDLLQSSVHEAALASVRLAELGRYLNSGFGRVVDMGRAAVGRPRDTLSSSPPFAAGL